MREGKDRTGKARRLGNTEKKEGRTKGKDKRKEEKRKKMNRNNQRKDERQIREMNEGTF